MSSLCGWCTQCLILVWVVHLVFSLSLGGAVSSLSLGGAVSV